VGGVRDQTDRQIELLFKAGDLSEPMRCAVAFFEDDPIALACAMENRDTSQAVESATLTRRALSIGNLPRLARTLRKYASDPYCYNERGRASCAILALAIEAIIARRPKPKPRKPRSGSKSTLAASAQIDRKPARKARIVVDNRVDGELIVCGNCGKEFPAKGRNRNVRIYCSPKCTNQAWTKAHPRRAA